MGDNSIILKSKDLGYTNPATIMLAAAKKCIEIWQRVVHITGEELDLDTSSYTVMARKLAKGYEKLLTVSDAPGAVTLQSENI